MPSVQTSKAKHWARCEGTSTPGQFTLWHEPPQRHRPKKEVISSMVFHLQEQKVLKAQRPCATADPAQCTRAVVEVMFVATETKHRKKKFFVQLLRLFMREVRAKQTACFCL